MALNKRYSDLDFKLRKLSSGDVNKVYDENAINQSLVSLFNTIRGERFFNLEYGSGLPFLLFEPFDSLTANSIVEEIKNIVKTWEDARIEIADLEIQLDYGNQLYIVDMSYRIKSTTETGSIELVLQKK